MRTPDEILANPNIGDVVRGAMLGYRHPCLYICISCPTCRTLRWTQNTKDGRARKTCRNCALAWSGRRGEEKQVRPSLRHYHPDATGVYKTIRAGTTPKVGDLIRGEEIGKNALTIYRWTLCSSCSIGRWLSKNTQYLRLCPDCGNDYKKEHYIGDKSSQWKGGRIGRRYGYFDVRVRPTSPYFPMANHIGYVPEHRLVMAKHLGRCLSRSEIVHHCHTKFPAGSDKDRGDNRIENLRLVQHKDAHDAITSLERQVRILKEEIETLKGKNRLNEWRIRELEAITQACSQDTIQQLSSSK